MRLAVKTGWLCGTGGFLLLTYTSVFRQIDLIEVIKGSQMTMEPITELSFAILGGAAGGMLGFLIGDILAKPKGKQPGKKGRKGGPSAKDASGAEGSSTGPVSGDETFLDDLDLADSTAALNPPPEPAPETPQEDVLEPLPPFPQAVPEEQQSR